MSGRSPCLLAGTNRTMLRMSAAASVHLLLEHLFNLSHFLLDFADELFLSAFGGQIGVVDDLSRFLFNGTLRLMQIAFDFVLRALIHLVSPL
jgi:hypothetical protein